MVAEEIKKYCPLDEITEENRVILESEAKGRKRATEALLKINADLKIKYTPALYCKTKNDPNNAFDIYFLSGTTTVCVEAKDRRKYNFNDYEEWVIDEAKVNKLQALPKVSKSGRPVEVWYISTYNDGYCIWDIEAPHRIEEKYYPISTDRPELGNKYKGECYYKNNDTKWYGKF